MSSEAHLDYAKYRQEILAQASLGKRLLRGLPEWWATVADTIAIFLFVCSFWTYRSESREVFFSLLSLSFFASFLLVVLLISRRKMPRAERYAYAFRGVHTAIHILRDQIGVEAGRESSSSPSEVKRCLEEVLGAVAISFTILTGTPTRACIKVIKTDPPEGKAIEELPPDERMKFCYARTLCRDFATAEQIGKLAEDPTSAPISHNTAFSFLFSDVLRRCFIHNDLPMAAGRGQYLNTSLNKYRAGGTDKWSLPYRSTMVWPIRRITSEPRKSPNSSIFTGSQEILGYLAVDSPLRKVFVEEHDFEVGALVADALYMFLLQHLHEAHAPPVVT